MPNTDEPNEIQLTVGDVATRALCVTMRWQHDRYVHHVDAINRGERQRVLTTIDDHTDNTDNTDHLDQDAPESPPVDASAWPANGALQQVSHQQWGERAALLGLGSAGRSHWSVAVEADDTQPLAIRFDFACRCSDTPAWLGNSYRWHESLGQPTDNDASTLTWTIGDAKLIFQQGDPQTQIQCPQPHGRAVVVRSKTFPVSGEVTFRWAYRIRYV